MYGRGSYFQIFAVKSIFQKNVICADMFYYIKENKLNNKITEIKNLSKPVKFIA